MPLIKSASPKAVGKNIAIEEKAGKRHDVAVAIALETQRRAAKEQHAKPAKRSRKVNRAQVI